MHAKIQHFIETYTIFSNFISFLNRIMVINHQKVVSLQPKLQFYI